MVIRLGTNEPNKLYVGTQEVQKIYRGSGLVWSAIPIDPSDGPTSSGSGIPAPTGWNIRDERATSGDIVTFDITRKPTPQATYTIWNYEVAVGSETSTPTVVRLNGGPATDYLRRIRTTAGEASRFWVRHVERQLNQIQIDFRSAVPLAGQTITQSSTGARAKIAHVGTIRSGKHYRLILDDITGQFEQDVTIEIGGNTGKPYAAIETASASEHRVDQRSEWSEPVTVTPSTGNVQVELTASKSNLIVGEGAYLEASVYGANTLRPIHDLHYRWYVTKSGEQGSFDALPDYFTAHFKNTRTEGYGSAWAFVPQTLGTTTVYCEVRDRSGVLATESINLSTQAATDVISAADTYVVSTSGDYAGTPEGAQRFTSLDEAFTAMLENNKANTFGQALILLRAGETFENSIFRFNRDQLDTFMMTSYGSGAQPTLLNNISLTCNTAIVHDLNFVGYYDPTDPMNMPDLGGGNCVQYDTVPHGTISNCKFSGHNISCRIEKRADDTYTNTILFDVEISDWGNFGILQGNAGSHALVGCYLHQNPRAWRGPGKAEQAPPFLADHGPFRSSNVNANRVFSKIVGFSCTHWGTTSAVQPTFRFFGDGRTVKPFRTIVSEMISEGTHMSITVTSRGGDQINAPSPQDIVIDKHVHITSTQPTSAVSIDFGGTTYRNFLVVQPNVLWESSTALRHMIGLNNQATGTGTADNDNNPIVIKNGSLIDLRDAATNAKNRPFSGLYVNPNNPLRNVTYENILEYAPDKPESPNGGPVDRTGLWDPEYIGRFEWAVGTPDYSFATPRESTASFAPQSGSAAYKSANTEFAPVDDLRGTLRSGSTSKGAFH